VGKGGVGKKSFNLGGDENRYINYCVAIVEKGYKGTKKRQCKSTPRDK